MRIHPAVIAQAAATSGVLHEGRFNLGVGSGEALNEHILGDRWPEADVRLEMLEEAVEVIRTLWQGGQQSHHGRHYTVENARIYDLPRRRRRRSSSPASGRRRSSSPPASATASARLRPDKDAIDLYRSEGGTGPVHAGTKVCFGHDEDEAARPRTGCGPTRRCPGELAQVLPTPVALRAGLRARHPRPDQRRPSARTSTSTSQRCGSTPTPASTSSSSSRSARSRNCSSASGRPRCSRGSAHDQPPDTAGRPDGRF